MQTPKHYFPGGNTPKGFYSYYSNILDKDSIGHLAVIKGGPGTGKSTFMKTLGKRLEESGEAVTYLHCSSDPASLDGLFLPRYNSAIIDGTAPHTTDPRYPGGADILLNFCEFIHEDKMVLQTELLRGWGEKISDCFSAGYSYLKAASAVRQLMESKSRSCLQMDEVTRFVSGLIKRLNGYSGKGTEKICFLSAITPAGFKHYLTEALNGRFVILLRAEAGDDTASVMEGLRNACRQRRINMEVFPCPMNPEVAEHIVFPDANLALTVANEYHTANSPDEVVYFSDFCSREYNNASEQIRYRNLISSAMEQFFKAKAFHDELEALYIPNVDFSGIVNMEERALKFLTQTTPK